ncbi:DUF86 domain-containing protein [Noviherbaspirillum denitrificans]|uniref:DUF86 domain-containing protein n=1 Tax=Noviherbaspirillum denitrificans TaxID=1968433 RepID=A0A254TH50_9BURK|nr:DUF86 domain-containing protein [Noviherbaspirillum denitrificans]OWW21855.1 hypothetical protein AYR66_22510 [Noviherbaspirillum denitrificans]
MTRNASRVPDYLEHIQQAIERIRRYTEEMDETAFLQNEMVQDAVIRNIEIVGEAANNIGKCDPDFADQHSDFPWTVIYALRNHASQSYLKIDLEIVWKTIQTELSPMHQQVVKLLQFRQNRHPAPKP